MQEEPLESIGWPNYFHPQPTVATKLYVLFSFVAVVATLTRLFALWLAVPPFRLSRQANNPIYMRRLRASSNSLKQWMVCALLSGGLVVANNAHEACRRILASKVAAVTSVLFRIDDISVTLTLVLAVGLFIFLVRWHLLNRIACLGNRTVKATQAVDY